MDKSLHVSASAKINLHLRVGPPTADGFHPLSSWMVTVGLFDKLEFTPADRPGVRLSCDDPAIPCDASNLIVKTGAALLAARPELGVTVTLQKRIPVGAGLGGGSADGAFTLMALNHLFGLRQSADELSTLAAQFGSDLSFFFHGPSSVCTGRGEIVNPTPTPKARYAVLILPGIHMATPAVYRRFDEMGVGDSRTLAQPPDWKHWATLGAEQLLPLLVNDLEMPAFAINERLSELRDRAEALLERPVRMSGSGSTLFSLYDFREEAEILAGRIRLQLSVDARVVELCPKSNRYG